MIGRLTSAFALALSTHPALAADSYPAKPVRVIAAFSPGGYVDFTSRLVSGPLGAALGQQFVVENRAGGATNIGSDLVA